MRLGEPLYLNLMWIMMPLIFFLVWGLKKKRRLTEQFCGKELMHKLVPEGFRARRKTKNILMALTVFFLALALTQPRWGYEWKDLRQRGVDIVIALDVSNSMLAQDIKPNRLERAKHKIADLLNMLEGDRVGLVAFAGTSFVQCPLTLDYSAAKIFLNAIDTDLIPVQGTAIAEAIRKSIKAFPSRDKKSRAIILITDGENLRGDTLQAAREAREQGVKIYPIGIGQETGAPIPNPAPQGGFKKDEAGEVILTKLDETSLQKIALETGGVYVRSVTGDMDLEKIYVENIKRKIQKKELKTERRKLWKERFQWMILLALICLLAESLMKDWASNPTSQMRRD